MKKDKYKKILIFLFLLPLLICGFACLLFGQWVVSGCVLWDCVDSGYFESDNIQLPRDFFPDEAAYGGLGEDHTSYGAKQYQSQQIYWGLNNGSTARLQVVRYFGVSAAKKRFTTKIRVFDEMLNIPAEPSTELNYQSASADQLFIGCGDKFTIWGGYQCVFVARYDQDLISLSMSIDKLMTLEDFKLIITYLDTVVAERLGH